MTIRKADGSEYKKVVTKTSDVTAHMTAKSGILGLDEATGAYLRTPVNGLIPNVSGGSGYVGTSKWPFNYGYFKNGVYVNGSALPKQSEVPLMGVTNEWRYFKFPSGLLIQIKYYSSSIANFASWGGVYSRDFNETSTYPITFIDNPIRLVTHVGSGTFNWWGSAFSNSSINHKTTFGSYSIIRGTQLENGLCQRWLVAIGRWK